MHFSKLKHVNKIGCWIMTGSIACQTGSLDKKSYMYWSENLIISSRVYSEIIICASRGFHHVNLSPSETLAFLHTILTITSGKLELYSLVMIMEEQTVSEILWTYSSFILLSPFIVYYIRTYFYLDAAPGFTFSSITMFL